MSHGGCGISNLRSHSQNRISNRYVLSGSKLNLFDSKVLTHSSLISDSRQFIPFAFGQLYILLSYKVNERKSQLEWDLHKENAKIQSIWARERGELWLNKEAREVSFLNSQKIPSFVRCRTVLRKLISLDFLHTFKIKSETTKVTILQGDLDILVALYERCSRVFFFSLSLFLSEKYEIRGRVGRE